MSVARTLLFQALDAALSFYWQGVLRIVQQDERDPMTCWGHAVPREIEGDARNSRYCDACSTNRYEEWCDPQRELRSIHTQVEAHHG